MLFKSRLKCLSPASRPPYATSPSDVDFTPELRRTSITPRIGATVGKWTLDLTSDVRVKSRARARPLRRGPAPETWPGPWETWPGPWDVGEMTGYQLDSCVMSLRLSAGMIDSWTNGWLRRKRGAGHTNSEMKKMKMWNKATAPT